MQPTSPIHEMMTELIRKEEELARLGASLEAQLQRFKALRDDVATLRVALADELSKPLDSAPLSVAGALSILPPVAAQVKVSGGPKEQKPPFASIEDVKGIGLTILEVVNEEPGKLWKSKDFIDEVERRAEDGVQRNTISTYIYRLKKSGLIGNDGRHIFSLDAYDAEQMERVRAGLHPSQLDLNLESISQEEGGAP